MVFGWGKKKEEKIIEEIPQQKEVRLSDVQKITDDLLKLRTNQTLSEIKAHSKQISPLIKELASIGKTLEKDDLKVDEIDKHLRIIVVRGKKQVIEIIKKESSSISDISSLDDAIELNNTLNQRLKKIGDVLGRQTRVIHIFAKKYAEKLKEILADMNSHNAEIQNLIKNFQDSNFTSEEITKSLEDLKNTREETIAKKQRISELETDLNSLAGKIKNIEKSVEQIKSSENYSEFKKLNESLSSFKNSKTLIKNEIDAQFTKISRPLGRYEYASSLDKEQKVILSQLINDPIEALTPSNKDSIIVILENVRKGIASGSISVKDIEKTMTHLTETEESLGNLTDKVDTYNRKRNELQKQISSFDNTELIELENVLKKSNEQKIDIESKITLFKKDIASNNENISKKIAEIESMLKKFSNTQYSIMQPTEN
ncbi:MAG: exonuclease SbcC [Nitrosopumilaceae archaeon]|jgi:chromosome segregation ATPase